MSFKESLGMSRALVIPAIVIAVAGFGLTLTLIYFPPSICAAEGQTLESYDLEIARTKQMAGEAMVKGAYDEARGIIEGIVSRTQGPPPDYRLSRRLWYDPEMRTLLRAIADMEQKSTESTAQDFLIDYTRLRNHELNDIPVMGYDLPPGDYKPKPDMLNRITNSVVYQKKWDDAARAAILWNEYGAAISATWVEGRIAHSKGDTPTAVKAFAISADAGHEEARLFLGECLLTQEDTTGARNAWLAMPETSRLRPFALGFAIANGHDDPAALAELDALLTRPLPQRVECSPPTYSDCGFALLDVDIPAEHSDVFAFVVRWRATAPGAASAPLSAESVPDRGVFVRRGEFMLQYVWSSNQLPPPQNDGAPSWFTITPEKGLVMARDAICDGANGPASIVSRPIFTRPGKVCLAVATVRLTGPGGAFGWSLLDEEAMPVMEHRISPAGEPIAFMATPQRRWTGVQLFCTAEGTDIKVTIDDAVAVLFPEPPPSQGQPKA